MQRFGSLLSVGANWSEVFLTGKALEQELRVTAIHDPPYFYISPQPDGSYTYDGYLYDIWQIIARELHLIYRIIPLLAGGYGTVDENGTWSGMVGELAYRRADIALAWLTIRKDREAVIDFIDAVPVEKDQYTFYVRQGSGDIPRVTLSMFSSLLKPLHMDVWWMLLVSLFVLSVVLRVSLRFNHVRAESRQTVNEMTWGSCLLSSFMSMVGQGWARTPDSMAARTVTISSWILGILINVNYTANLISYLTVVTVDKPISSLHEFSEQPGWTFAIEPGIGNMNDWKVSSNKYERELFQRSVRKTGYLELNLSSASVKRIIAPNVVTFIDIKRLFYSLGPDACHLVPLLDELPAKSRSFMAIGRGLDEMRAAINQVMRKMNQAGSMSRLRKQWLPTGKDMCESASGFKELSLGDLLAVLIIVPLATAVSVGLFLAECAWSRLVAAQKWRRQPCWGASVPHRKQHGNGSLVHSWAK